jgi:hypothetical protein
MNVRRHCFLSRVHTVLEGRLMIRKISLALAVVVTCLCVAAQSEAALLVTKTIGGQALNGVNYASFDAISLGSGGGVDGPLGNQLTLALDPDAKVVTGAVSGQYAQPFLSGQNNANFGALYTGADNTRYVTSGRDGGSFGPASATMTFASDQNYLGLLWGSVDDYNTLEFYKGNTLLYTLLGSALPDAGGNQGVNGTFYVNVRTSQMFDKVVAKSSQYAFEFDNVAYGVVPEPAAVLAWGVLGLVGVFAVRRGRRRA